MFVLRARPVIVAAIEEVKVVALESWERFWMNSYSSQISSHSPFISPHYAFEAIP